MKTDAFALRHIGPRETDLEHMFKTIGVNDMTQLLYETFPDGIRLKKDLELDPAMTELNMLIMFLN
jgi:glycine dehydrogenase